MSGQSPLSMMRPERQRALRPKGGSAPGRRRLWPVIAAAAVVVLAAGWCALWYFSASVADRTLNGWVEREAAAGRVYSCGSQTISGFPFRIVARCDDASAELRNNVPPFALKAKDISFLAEVFRPMALTGEVSSPVTVAVPDQPTSFVGNWSLARVSVRGIPPEPDSLVINADHARVDRVTAGNSEMVFTTERTDLNARVVSGSAANNPVIEVTLRFTGTAAPTLHPLLSEPLKGEADVVLRGFKDLLPKPWAVRFHEMQAAGGDVEIKSLRVERTDAIVVGNGKLTVNERGKLDGLIRVAVAGIEKIVPLLGIERAIGQGIDRLSGSSGSGAQGLNALDKLLPGLGGVIRDSVVENVKRMGQPTEIDKKPAVVLPLRFADGVMSLGVLPITQVPPLF